MVRCPKCRSNEITVHEHFTVSSSIFFEGKVVVGVYGAQSGDSQDKYSGECEPCGHKWRLAKKTGRAAVHAAREYEEQL
jgi:DNA-directed RNA polymerase subunit M/transcription elongation factor TFIIS